MDFTGKTVVVTGSSRGIGKAIAEKFAALGANVVINGTSKSVFDTERELVEKGYSVKAFEGDISDPGNAKALIDFAVETFGTIDVLVNNAGITRDKLLVRMNDEDWDTVIDVNLKSAYLCTKAATKIMMRKRQGKIINISSVVGITGNAGQTNYAASKAGLIGFTKAVAKEMGSWGITCNAVAPGFIETDMTSGLSNEIREKFLAAIPLRRAGTPSEVADAVVFLASDMARYITGQVINIDGGMVM
ncbi:3-oxoacyl-[acyl-carrier-protein] reductase FabG [Thermoclostridium stercorarium subsp. stercorarium DSM 8532]|uniref:3-oxoacyl-[acyl-carrier-protein] reductase n=1 Tax=Thermoclostridium stercorarium (strain ATCC 35414 / DSM 8532 / NCIMB 11754) TaxID=1121335 RepID=L7VNZ4_THES1|nr:3-oxoacyl-[acyl-carrier-protein] reductase [Thermoclostridium stercorarium]AGC68151.1 3-oxoacyl-[acyl-carrier-protein] reductase FabG [Thermoclostridium stercorarium subsp. stercorarium DSM 8532]AGI39177.1 3-oxoacyl-acyl-carrier-protein reductase [Thermoclostridium stercorarium subsp. stercorarium DSM 8532]